MYIDAESIITIAALATAIITLGGILIAAYRWYDRQNQQDIEIKRIKKEQCLLTYGILACLKGLKEQGCNGPVTEAIDKLEKHMNKAAHDEDEA